MAFNRTVTNHKNLSYLFMESFTNIDLLLVSNMSFKPDLLNL